MKLEAEKAWLGARIAELEAQAAGLRLKLARLRLILLYTDEPRVAASQVQFIAENQPRIDLSQGIDRRKSSLH